MKYFALYPQTQVLLEAPCNKWSFSKFKQAAKECADSGEYGPAEIYIGKTWEGREFVCNLK